MKMTTLLLFTLLLCPLQAREDVIKNTTTPKGKAYKLVFEEDLRLDGSRSNDENHFWAGGSIMVDADAKGNMYVTDPVGSRVVVFAPDGSFLRRIGKEGQGPSDFQSLYSFYVLQDQTGVAFSNHSGMWRFQYFDKEMNFARQFRSQRPDLLVLGALLSPDGERMGSMFIVPNPNKPLMDVYSGVLNSGMEPVLKLTESEMEPFRMDKTDDGAWWEDYLAQYIRRFGEGMGLVALDAAGHTITANTYTYQMDVYDTEMKKIRTIVKDEPAHIFDEALMLFFLEEVRSAMIQATGPRLSEVLTYRRVERAIEKAGLPPRRPFLLGLTTLPDGGIVAVTEYEPSEPSVTADLFDKDGHFIGTTALPPVSVSPYGMYYGGSVKLVFKNNFAYGIVTDGELETAMVRYRYKLVAQ